MRIARRARISRMTLLVVSCAMSFLTAAGQENPPAEPTGPPTEISDDTLIKDLDIRAWGPWRQTADRDYIFEGKVTIEWRGSRIQADRMTLTGQRHVEAEGNVLVVWKGSRITGARMTYDLLAERGVIEEAMGQVEGEYLFWADRAEKIGDRTVHLDSATITTCTQPVPYWSFSVSSATVTMDAYARMWNVRLRARRAPIVYLPYLVWPVKDGRALGLLMPEFHSSESRGQSISQQLFIPLGRSADLTLLGQYYTQAGFGGGGELRFVPNQQGAARMNGFYIDDKVAEKGRYSASYEQTQQFNNGFRMIADINLVSDFEYYSDFERELSLVSSPTILARLEFSRNGRWTSLNVRELRREQLFADETSLVQQTLPEIEWRGRSRKLGSTPFYLSYESSIAAIQQRGSQRGSPIDADYLRGDLFPEISLPWSATPWLDINPRVNHRLTYYTQRQFLDSGSGTTGQTTIVDENVTRQLWGAGLDIIGPKFFRIFENSAGRRFKHAIEPRVSYGYRERFDDIDEIIPYDEVDRVTGAGNELSYGITQRLFAKRPQAEQTVDEESAEPIVMPDGSVDDGTEPGREESSPETDRTSEPLEIASLELRQNRSFDSDLSFADLDGDGVVDASSRSSRLQLIGRYNPSISTSVDLRSSYDVLYDAISDVTVSGAIRRQLAQIRFSLVHRNGLGVIESSPGVFEERPDDTQVRLTAGLTFFRNKVSVMVDGLWDVDPEVGQKHVPDKRWRVQYRTQCCAFLLERLSRNYSAIADRRDFYFRVDLTGIGKILDVKY